MYLKANQKAWNQVTKQHAKFQCSEKKRVIKGLPSSGMEAIDCLALRELGPLDGKRGLHLLCNSGLDTITVGRNCKSLLGVDFSDEAISMAKKFALSAKSSAKFECREVLDFLQTTTQKFDFVFCCWGFYCWVQNLDLFTRALARVLNRDGFFYILDAHPILMSINQKGGIEGLYFSKIGKPIREMYPLDYYGKGKISPTEIYWWQWTLGDIVTSFCNAGFKLRFLREHPFIWRHYFGSERKCAHRGNSAFLPQLENKIPLSFSLKVMQTKKPHLIYK